MKLDPFFIIISIVGLVFAVITCLLGIYVRKRIVKYIPTGVAGIASSACFIKAFYFSKGFEGLGYIVYAMILAAAFAVSIVSAVVIEVVFRRK